MHSYTSSCLGMLKNCPAFINFFHTVAEAWTVGPTWAGDWEVRTFASFQKSRDRFFFGGGRARLKKLEKNSMDMEDIPDGPKKFAYLQKILLMVRKSGDSLVEGW